MSRSLDRLSPDLQQFLERELRFRPARVTPIRGGDINEAFRLVNEEGASLFLKSNRKAPPFLFEREAEGLRWLAETRALRVPEVRGVSVSKGNEGPGWLLLEWIDSGPRSARYDDALGRGLAALHSFKGDPPRSLPPNYIGTLPQSNRLRATWTEFYAEERLRPLVQMALGRRLAPSPAGAPASSDSSAPCLASSTQSLTSVAFTVTSGPATSCRVRTVSPISSILPLTSETARSISP
ncbi:MAG: hypothetical protein B6A08_18620 [Sorangiineae bacterium NIC37A_2]|nr:MAG: hypothetical protein B6A08_18620 [Sorangiineae bacterium NIC37A_2]